MSKSSFSSSSGFFEYYTEAAGVCSNQHQCDHGGKCISPENVCDGNVDCDDYSDEEGCHSGSSLLLLLLLEIAFTYLISYLFRFLFIYFVVCGYQQDVCIGVDRLAYGNGGNPWK